MPAEDMQTSPPDQDRDQDREDDEAARLRRVTDAAPLLISYVDREFRYRFANRAYADWFGVPQAGVSGRHVSEVIGAAAFERVRHLLEAALQGERLTYEAEMPYAASGPRHVHTEVVPDRAPDGTVRGFVAVIADITEHRLAEQGREAALRALATSEADLRYFTTHARCLLWQGTVYDLGHPQFFAWDTHVLDEAAAQAFCPLDLRPGEKYTDAWYRCRLPEGRALTDAASRDALLEDRPEYQAEFGCEDLAGEVRWFSERVYVEPLATEAAAPRRRWRVVGVCIDVTERRTAEEARARQERELSALIGASPDIISRFTPDLRCAFTSPAVERLMGRPPEFFLGKTHAELGAPPEMCEIADGALRRIFATGRPENIAFSLPDPYGRMRAYEATGVPLFAPDGVTVESVMTVSRDVSARRRAEEEREAALAERTALLAGLAEAALTQRAFLRDVLYSVSEGKFRLCDSAGDLPERLPDVDGCETSPLSDEALGAFRRRVRGAAGALGFADERVHDLLTAVGEAGMNAVRHGGRAPEGRVCADPTRGTIQAWLMDRGGGIGFSDIHRAVRRGYSSAGTLGHGFWLMMQTADRLFLLTGPEGTTVVIEQDRTPPEPVWLSAAREFEGPTATTEGKLG